MQYYRPAEYIYNVIGLNILRNVVQYAHAELLK